jgi:hypothetical protein
MMSPNPTTERYITGIRDNHLASTAGANAASIKQQDQVLTTAITGLREGLPPDINDATLGEVLIHVSVEISALAGALEQRGYPADQIPNILINVLGLAGVRLYVGAEATGAHPR